MEQLSKISLNIGWHYRQATESEDYAGLSIDDSKWEQVDFGDIEKPSSNIIWLRRRFDLTPMTACVRYFLRCDESGYAMTIYLRGQVVAEVDRDSAIDIDVTDYVSLDDNVMVLAIRTHESDFESQGTELYLQPVLCDDLA